MKKTAPAVIMALAIATLVVISLGCSSNNAPAQSVFAAEHGAWIWVQATGGMNNEELEFDSVSFYRVMNFTSVHTVEFYQILRGETFTTPDYTVGYTIEWENVGSERVKVLHYENDFHAPQTVEFPGRDSLVLTDLVIDGYTHTYIRIL